MLVHSCSVMNFDPSKLPSHPYAFKRPIPCTAGGMTTLVAALSQDSETAQSAVLLLRWLCLEPSLSHAIQAKHLAVLSQMKGLHRLSLMLCPDLSTLSDAALSTAAGELLLTCITCSLLLVHEMSIDLQGSYCYIAHHQCASSIPTAQMPVFVSRLLKLSACCLLIG